MLALRKVGDWAAVGRITRTMNQRYQASVRQALMREAHFWRGEMIKGIASGAPGGAAFAPLSPITLAMRKARGFGGSKPLIVTGALRRSITVVQVRGGTGIGGAVFVGVHRATKGKDGKSMVDLASIHEFGRSWTQNLSPRARKYLFAVLGKAGGGGAHRGKFLPAGAGGKGTISIHIPARPFIRPIIQKFGKPEAVKRRFVENVLQGMGGDFKLLGGG